MSSSIQRTAAIIRAANLLAAWPAFQEADKERRAAKAREFATLANLTAEELKGGDILDKIVADAVEIIANKDH